MGTSRITMQMGRRISMSGVVTEFGFFTDHVTDISPVRALAGLNLPSLPR